MKTADLAYSVAVMAARSATPLLALGNSKLARSLRGRSAAAQRLRDWGHLREAGRPLVWFHAPSVGEGLQARAVLRELRGIRPDVQTVFTHTSPSAEPLARSIDVDVADYLPWDGGAGLRSVFDALAPSAIVFTQREVWPGIAAEARRRDVPLVLAAATLPEGARRIRWPARWFLRATFERLDAVLAIGRPDARRFELLGVDPARVVVTGDPGIDSARERAGSVRPDAPHLSPFLAEPAPTVVAGSTWPADEAVLLPAMLEARTRLPGVRLVVAPHEPTAQHVQELEAALQRDGWTVRRLSSVVKDAALAGSDAVVVDSVGVLAELYTVASAAVVGGAFDQTGIHSVLEPAAAGLPMAFGPHHRGSRAAGELVEEGAARSADGPHELASALLVWLGDEGARARDGAAGREYLESHRGAAGRTAARVAALLPS